MQTYRQLLIRLLSVNIQGGVKLGLDNCRRLDEALGFPSQAFPSIHIAGTNGKGSVSTKIAAALQADGKCVGLYTSPHISCFRERIRINGRMITEEEAQHHLNRVFAQVQTHGIPATFFELTTLMAFDYFAHRHIDVAVVETGLGGRLDATNIVHTELAVITSISLDHTDILGATVEQIAKEKAGIIKPNAPVVLGPRLPATLFEEIAAQQSSPCIQVSGSFPDFFAENEAIAKTALERLKVKQTSIDIGLKALPPCRLEIFPEKNIILDVAHNPDGLTHLLKAIQRRFGHVPLRFVVGLSQNKDLPNCLKLLKEAATCFHLVEAQNGRAAPKELLKAYLLEAGALPNKIFCETSVAAAIEHASKGQELTVICGTFFIMAEARQALGIDEPRDPQDLN